MRNQKIDNLLRHAVTDPFQLKKAMFMRLDVFVHRKNFPSLISANATSLWISADRQQTG